MQVKKRDGTPEAVDRRKIARCVERACRGLDGVDAHLLVEEAFQQLYDGISTSEIDRLLVLAARARIIDEPNYSFAAARLLLHSLYKEAFGHGVDNRRLVADYRRAFVDNLRLLVGQGVLDRRMEERFALEEVAGALQPDRDSLFAYLGVQTLYDRYLLRVGPRRLETPQAFWMRVAMGLSLEEQDPTRSAIEAYELYSRMRVCQATPTLFNAGTVRPQLSSCYLSTLEDSIDGIYGTLHGQARLSKHAGGLGIDVTPLRGAGSYIRGTNGESRGVVPWARQINDMALAVNQGGRRPGAVCLYLETWHIDIFDFLELKKNTGDERRRCHDINTANWIPDLFLEQVERDGDWWLFSPDECRDLHDLVGEAFRARYWHYVEQAEQGEMRNFSRVPAKELWKKMLASLKETGHPWMVFKDVSNLRYANRHVGVVHSSNLCCVAGDQRVVTDRGILLVKELARQGGPLVVAGRDGQKAASHMALTVEDSPLVVVRTVEGFSHKVTPDHPLWVVDVGWVEARHLKWGDRVESQRVSIWGPRHVPAAAASAATGDSDPEEVPAFVWEGDRETAMSYLGGLTGVDVTASAFTLSSVRPAFLQDVQVLLANLGVESRTRRYGDVFVLEGEGPSRKGYLTVSSVDVLPNEDVYCLMVDADDRAWTCNGFITKNTEVFEHSVATRYQEGEAVEVGETAVCNLASINVAAHATPDGEIDWELLADTVTRTVRLLDNVIDINYYPTREARASNLKNRPVGMGMMGWADLLHLRKLEFDSDEAERLADRVGEFISYHAILASARLAVERGVYPNYSGSLWAEGKFPVDTYHELYGGQTDFTLDWAIPREAVRQSGMRNGLLQAIAPTATISSIVGCSPCIEPDFSCLFVYTTLSGDFTMASHHLSRELKARGLWTPELVKALQASDGDVRGLGLPEDLEKRFRVAFDIDQKRLVDIAATRQKWLCQGQSLNLFYRGNSMKAISELYLHAWRKGLKSTYYLRSEGAGKVEKVSACSLQEGCESCQ